MPVELHKSRALDLLNMTPFIDVVFILLIFFLVAAKFANEDRELPVQLPSAQSAIPMTMEPEVLVVGVNQAGGYFVEGQVLTLEALEARIQKGVRDNPISQTVVIRGDRRVPFQHVVAVMDICRKSNVPSYKVTTASPAEKATIGNE
jgi:biopolymer transport protein ExbD